MKIFNWVHRRFTHKDGLTQDERKSSGFSNNGDESGYDDEFVHENNALISNVFDGWRGGILTIGTFGYDPLKDEIVLEQLMHGDAAQEPEKENESHRQMITDSEEEEEKEEEEEEEEVNPLVFAAYEHDYDGLLEMKMDGNRVSIKDEIEFEFEFNAMMMMKKNTKKERTTLAELFSADSDSEEVQKKKQPINNGDQMMIKENKPNGFSFAKKLIMGDQDARPIRKLHRLMRRMLKRKIHPDMGVNKQQQQQQNNNNPVNCSKVVAKKCEISGESASLLSTQVADAIM